MDKYLIIPMTNNRMIKLCFKPDEKYPEHHRCIVTDEFLEDINTFSDSGWFVLDQNKKLEVISKE